MAANPNAVWTELCLVTQTVIQGLGLVYGSAGTALPNPQVYLFKFPNDQYRLPTGSVLYPCVQIAPGRMEDVVDREQDFEDTEMVYPVLVAILFATNQQLSLNNDCLYWRQQIIDAFIDMPDSLRTALEAAISDANVYDCRLAPAPLIDPSMFQLQNLDASMFYLQYHTTRSRGRN